jgi:hypothetical protein
MDSFVFKIHADHTLQDPFRPSHQVDAAIRHLELW